MALELSDDDVCRAAEGDSVALTRLIDAVGPALGARLQVDGRWRRMIDVEDILQVTYIEAFRRIAHLETKSVAGFTAWLTQIARNNLRDAVRGLRSAKRPDGRGRVVAEPEHSRSFVERLRIMSTTPSRVVAVRELASRLPAAVKSLPPRYARLIDALIAGRSVPEIAAEMKKTPAAVHMLRARALEALREVMEE